MSDNYEKLLVKEYIYWGVYLYKNQGYLSRCYIWCKREDIIDFSEITKKEGEELIVILKELKQVVTKIFEPDLLNYAFLGNNTNHLHGHFIPRYQNKKEFMGVIFEDKLWGHNYQTDPNFVTPQNVLLEIFKKIKENI